MALYGPMVFAIIEFFLNRILIPKRVVFYVIGINVIYLFATFMGQFLMSQAIYPDTLDWKF